MKKTIAELIDELSVTNIKIALILEKGKLSSLEELQKVQDLNKYRSQIKNAINLQFGERQEIKV